MQIAEHVIGVCSWSMRVQDLSGLVELMRKLGVSDVQLALGGLLACGDAAVDASLKTLEAGGVKVISGMIGFEGEDYSSIATIQGTGGFVPDQYWDQRRETLAAAAKVARRLGLKQVSTHVGSVPPSSEASYDTIVMRVRDAADLFADAGLSLLLETGQETANVLLQFLNDVAKANVGVNFDPANMILYGAGNPVDAVRILDRHIQQVHVKDAVASAQPGTIWGEEVPFGKGQVNAKAFLAALRYSGYRGPLVIEREAGPSRLEDVEYAIGVIRSVLAAE